MSRQEYTSKTPTGATIRALAPDDQLHAYWSEPANDLILHAPFGRSTHADTHYLSERLGTIVDELARRGYDPKTIKFSIEPARGNQRFASQRDGDA